MPNGCSTTRKTYTNKIPHINNPENMEFKRNIIVTGGAGFIGSHVVRLFVNQYPEYRIIKTWPT